jgi:hypothetical protein
MDGGTGAALHENAYRMFGEWAGSEAERGGLLKEGLPKFLDARQKDVSAAGLPEWSEWLAALAATPSRELRAWVLARRLEGGDMRWYQEHERMVFGYVRALSGAGAPNDGSRHFPLIGGPIPSPFTIDSRSAFWEAFEKTIRDSPDLNLSDGRYAVWCFNTHPEQRGLILDLAKNVMSKESGKSYPSPWDDPRFWIVMDWLYSWGSREDFASVQELLPTRAKSIFSRLSKEASKLLGFFVDGQSALNQILNTGLAYTAALREPAGENEMSEIYVHTPVIKSKQRAPKYPQEAASRGLATDISMELLIGEGGGRPVSCRPRPGPWLSLFAPAGIKWAMGFEFEPLPTPSRFTLQASYRKRSGDSMTPMMTQAVTGRGVARTRGSGYIRP